MMMMMMPLASTSDDPHDSQHDDHQESKIMTDMDKCRMLAAFAINLGLLYYFIHCKFADLREIRTREFARRHGGRVACTCGQPFWKRIAVYVAGPFGELHTHSHSSNEYDE